MPSCEDIAQNLVRWRVDGEKVNFARGKIPSGGKISRKCIHIVYQASRRSYIAQSLVGLRVSDIAAVTKARREARWNLQWWPKLANRSQPLVGLSSPYYGVYVYDILLLNNFFPIVDTCLTCEDIARQSCAMVPRWRFLATFLRPVFAASRVPHISDMHSKFALRPHHMWQYGRHPISGRWD